MGIIDTGYIGQALKTTPRDVMLADKLGGNVGLLGQAVATLKPFAPAAGFLAVAGIIGLGAYLAFGNKKKRPRTPPNLEYQHIQALTGTVQNPIVNQRVVFGECDVPGVVCLPEASGGYNIRGYLLAAHEIDDVMQMTINGQPLYTDDHGYVINEPYYNPRVFVRRDGNQDVFEERYYLRANFRLGINEDGTQQEKDMLLNHRIPSIDEKFRQMTHATAYLEFYRGGLDTAAKRAYRERTPADAELEHERVWGSSGQVPDPLFRIRGLKCYDPRTGRTEWTRNASLIIHEIMTNPLLSGRNDIDASNFDLDRWRYTADKCDEGFEILPNTDYPHGAVFRKGTLDGVVQTSESLISVLQSMFLCSRTSLGWRRDKYELNISEPRNPVITITDADFEGDISVQFERKVADSINTVKASYRDAAGDGQMTEAPEIFKGQPGGKRRYMDLVLRYTSNTYRAQYYADAALNETMLEKQIGGTMGRRLHPVEVYDVVNYVSEVSPGNSGTYIVASKDSSLDGTTHRMVFVQWDNEAIFDQRPGFETEDTRHPVRDIRTGGRDEFVTLHRLVGDLN